MREGGRRLLMERRKDESLRVILDVTWRLGAWRTDEAGRRREEAMGRRVKGVMGLVGDVVEGLRGALRMLREGRMLVDVGELERRRMRRERRWRAGPVRILGLLRTMGQLRAFERMLAWAGFSSFSSSAAFHRKVRKELLLLEVAASTTRLEDAFLVFSFLGYR
jgi:hypothetical protein